MVRIKHIATALDRWDNWNEYDETTVRRLLKVDQTKASVVSQRAANSLIDGLFPGHQHGIFRGQVKCYLARLNHPQDKLPGKSATEHCDSGGDNV